MKCKIYKVGGAIRDKLIGRDSNDDDFTFVIEDSNKSLEEGFAIMRQYMIDNGFTIFLETPDCVTIRGKMPDGTVGDFVLARKEIGYKKGTRKPIVLLGTLEDDLRRRDFTVNAIALGPDGKLIDKFNGIEDLKTRTLSTPLDPMITLRDDPLRIIRAIRFSVVLGFKYDDELYKAMCSEELPELMHLVSTDRIRQELTKSFKADNWGTFNALKNLPELLSKSIINREELWFKPTTEKSNN